jgi:hypothetical protein
LDGHVKRISAENPKFTVVTMINEESLITEDSYVAEEWMKDTKEMVNE